MPVGQTTVHCKKCHFCVQGFDHHCEWLNICIGVKNYLFFFLFVFSVFFNLIFQIFCDFYAVASIGDVSAGDVRIRSEDDPGEVESEVKKKNLKYFFRLKKKLKILIEF